MQFDFTTFSSIAARCYDGGPYSLEETLQVFRCYFQAYEAAMGRPHPPIRWQQIRRIMGLMPWLTPREQEQAAAPELRPADYPALIDRYFAMPLRCDRNINHFFSGHIRQRRLQELQSARPPAAEPPVHRCAGDQCIERWLNW